MNKENLELIIIGGGPAGLSAGIYASRAGLKTLILERGILGGIAATTDLIENYPGFPEGMKGMELAERMKRQCERFGVQIKNGEVNSIAKEENGFVIKSSLADYRTKAVIIATGSSPKRLNIPGEAELFGRGVSYCATCDGPLFKNQDIAVIGCGNSGLQEGLFLLNFVKSITFIEFLPYITADNILQERLKGENRVKFLLNHNPLSINGKNRVESITVMDRGTNEKKIISVSGIFIYVGLIPNSQIFKDIVHLDKNGFIHTNEELETSVPGIFAAGDVRAKRYRQVVIACSEGAIAAMNAYHYIKG
uniref:Thioredoxin reductase n=1 Tax=candidate division WOR-3 bacterium TaxID=2052148 RepID=A0A7C4X8T1_UNCW3